ncbi:interleukin-21 [Limanda limanda]|uniref:interleukin-21 n=1 Tax=Limanda limanda TaxID=27771 RepID=UPI0029C953AA|nr:interleukin-21 [Limanda limanda]
MKLVVLFLAAVCCCCCSLGSAGEKEDQKYKLQEVRSQLGQVKKLEQVKKMMQNETMLNSPPHDVEDCCYLSALQCFHDNLEVHFNGTRGIQRKPLRSLRRSLKNPLTKKAVEHCPPEKKTTTTCHECNSQPKVNVTVFLDRLESLIQQALTRLESK